MTRLRLAQRVAPRGGFVDATVALHVPPKDLPASIPLPMTTLLYALDAMHDVALADVSNGSP